ncbi:MAG: SLC13 family permease [Candidatus Omnitrophota bacterium]
MELRFLTLTLFVFAYLLFIFLPGKRTYIALIASCALIISRCIGLREAFFVINWNVMGIFVGTLVIADLFMESRMPAYLAELIVNRSKNTCIAMLFICALTGFISAFVENVATVLIVAPIALALSKKLHISPVKLLIAIAISSNLQGTATLIGDPPSMLLGGFAKMNFMDFFFYKGKPSIFFAVQAGALVSFVVLYYIFRKEKKQVELLRVEKIKSLVPTFLLVALIIALAISSFFDTGFSFLAGTICLITAFLGLLWDAFANKGNFIARIKALDWETTFFLVGVFILVGSLTLTGWIDVSAGFLSQLIGQNIFLGFVLLVTISVVLSAFIDNVPFLAAMLPVTVSVAQKLSVEPTVFLFGLLIGTSLGGNITPIGASANIVSVGILKKEGYQVKFMDFVKIGLPFTIVAVLAACCFVWVVWKP